MKNIKPHFLIQQITRETLLQMKQAQLLMVASSLAYTTILSIIPFLAVSFSIFQVFGGLKKLYDIVQPIILSNLAEGASEEVIHTLNSFINNAHAGAVGLGGLIGLIFTSMSMLYSIEKSVNLVWHVPMNRNLFHRISSYWMFITLGPLAFSVLAGLVTSSLSPLNSFLPNGTGIFLLNTAFFFSIYKFIPNTSVQARHAWIAALVTAPIWHLVRTGYVLYAKNALTYHEVYGSLAAIPLLLLWIYIMWVIVLTGAALTATLQKRLPPFRS